MKAVNWTDFNESGCVNCGCDYCYADHISGPTTPVVCGECGTRFLVISDKLDISSIGIPKEGYKGLIIDKKLISRKNDINSLIGKLFSDVMFKSKEEIEDFSSKISEGIAVDYDGYVHPIPFVHPRKGIVKHKYVKPDVRPENGIGDFCTPRGVGYDLACFVKSREAGQRITDMINKVNEEFNKKGFSCWLDYREHEPNWIQVKIDYPSEMKAILLSGLIHDNGNIITEEIVREALTRDFDFPTYWRYISSDTVYNTFDSGFFKRIVENPFGMTKEAREEAYGCSWQRINYLDQFECFGMYKQINTDLSKNNIDNAISMSRHFLGVDFDLFNSKLTSEVPPERDYVVRLRKVYHDELINALKAQNIDYDDSKDLTCGNVSLSDDKKNEFVNEWKYFVPELMEAIDLELLKKATDLDIICNKDKTELNEVDRRLGEYTTPYIMFSLFGLYVQVSRNIELGQIETAILAIKHVADQSYLFLDKKETNSNSVKMREISMEKAYAKICAMAQKYYNLANNEDFPRQLVPNK